MRLPADTLIATHAHIPKRRTCSKRYDGRRRPESPPEVHYSDTTSVDIDGCLAKQNRYADIQCKLPSVRQHSAPTSERTLDQRRDLHNPTNCCGPSPRARHKF